MIHGKVVLGRTGHLAAARSPEVMDTVPYTRIGDPISGNIEISSMIVDNEGLCEYAIVILLSMNGKLA